MWIIGGVAVLLLLVIGAILAYANCQIALTFVGMSLYVAVDRPHSMFNASARQSLAKQRQLILNDAILLKKAGEILILGADALTGSSYG